MKSGEFVASLALLTIKNKKTIDKQWFRGIYKSLFYLIGAVGSPETKHFHMTLGIFNKKN